MRPSLSCPPGAEQRGVDKCLIQEALPATKLCARGYAPAAAAAICEKVEEQRSEIKCPTGFKIEDGICRLTSRSPATAVCPADHEFTGRECVRIQIVDPTPKCEGLYHYHEGKCLKIMEKEVTLECPLGFDLSSENKCVHRATVRPHSECPEGAVSVHLLGRLSCESMRSAPAAKGCPPDYVLEHERCIRRSMGVMSFSCPAGFKLNGEVCGRESIIRPTEHCSGENILRDGGCYSSDTSPMRMSCNIGDLTPQGTCVRIYIAEMVYSCPRGFKVQGNSCIRRAYSSAAATCPLGSRMRGAECISTEVVQPLDSCSEGFVADQKNNCVKYETKAPKRTCPKTHKLFNTYCVRKADDPLIRPFRRNHDL